MPDPTLRQLVESSRPVRDLAKALQAAFQIADAALAAEAGAARAETLRREAEAALQALEATRAALGEALAAEREGLLAPARAERARVGAETTTIRERAEAEKQAFDAERGRRTSILKALEEQADSARRANREEVAQLRDAAQAESVRLQVEIERLKSQAALAREEVDGLRADYRGVQEAAAKLLGR